MSKEDKNFERPSDVRRYALALAVAWTILIVAFLVWNAHQEIKNTLDIVRTEAVTHLLKEQAFHYWGASHGGVYVPPDEHTPANPHLSHIPERDLVTDTGKKLTLMNPAYMARQMMEDYAEIYGVRGCITSLKPLRPENAPDEWEIKALSSFEKGQKEAMEFTTIDDQPFLRLMRPMIVEKTCLKCHGHQGYKQGDVRGGIGVSVPTAPFFAVTHNEIFYHSLGFTLIWLVGLTGIVIAKRNLSKRIRKQRNAENLLRESETKHRELTENLPQRIFHKDANSVYVSCNKHYAQDLGIKPDDIAGTTDFDYYPKELAEKYRADDKRLMQSRQTEKIEESYIKGGQELFIQIVRTPLTDDAGNVTGILGIFWDTTERKKAEEEMQKLATVARYSSELINLATLDGKMIFLNEAGSKMLGIDPDEVKQSNITQVIPDHLKQIVETELLPTLKDSRTWEGELQYRNLKTGKLTDVHTIAFTIQDPVTSEPLYLANVSRDITERKQAEQQREKLLITIKAQNQQLTASEQQLRASSQQTNALNQQLIASQQELSLKNEELQSIVYISSHDLKTPLININGFSEMLIGHCGEMEKLLEKCDTDADTKKEITSLLNDDIPTDLDYIRTSTERMKRLIGGLLQVSRIGTAKIETQNINMNDLLTEIIDTVKYKTQNLNAEIVLEKLPECTGDKHQIAQVFTNLVDNALNYLSPDRKGRIKITGKTKNKENIYCIEDNGIGIKQAYHGKVFEIYHRLDPRAATEGDGLGLTIVRRILDRHKGRIWLDSKPEEGTKFFIAMPTK